MFSSLQPSRPKARLIHDTTARKPLHQHQIRSIKSPRTQIEAMPPHQAPVQSPALPLPQFNPATMHPVFFTEHWRKPPFQMPMASGFSPVATGYVFGDNKRRNTSTKL
ncbi:hypothetical protein AMS68_004409 [Peltaster fructicola]|uniref:Uncharacterized protein n=1 Tax=Peltaster fructicola TaxID=286661 RepID=A0A6H0XVU7_9PEZI|nr:hypothetical protein AMS68_004409 [Peltaster fructicola]